MFSVLRMPIQAPQWTDYLNCPVCCREFGHPPRSPISLGCGHTLCKQCLKNLHRKQCPFDQTVIQTDLDELVVNTALLQLAGYRPPAVPYHPPCIQALPEHERRAYDTIVHCLEQLALYLYCSGNNGIASTRLSRPMQRKLVTLLQCAMTDEEGRGRAARAARSLGERTVTELILQHQNSQQLSANLWAAVRARGCQFLGPAMQEEVLKLVLLALEDGSALSRKVLVMFVVQRLEPHFPQASKTSIGHVVQLLYRASCFKVSKRECDSSLMQLKEEFRTYETLRREHDAQIVQIATEAGLRIAPDQWSALLYGDTAHKSHMQSIIDKLQTPQSFAQSVQELYIALQRTGDIAQLVAMSRHLNYLATIDISPETKGPTWIQLSEIIASIKEVISCLHFCHHIAIRDANCAVRQNGMDQSGRGINNKISYKMLTCRDSATREFCPRRNMCPHLHIEEEFERIDANRTIVNNDGTNNHAVPLALSMPAPIPIAAMPQQMPQQMTPQFVQPIPIPLPSHVSLTPMQLPAGVQLHPPVPLPGHMYAQYPVAQTVPHPYNCVRPVTAVPLIQPNGAMIQNPSGPVWFNPFYAGYYPHADGNCYPAPEFVQGGVMVPPNGYQNVEGPQPSAGGNAFVPQQYDPARASPYSIDGGHADGSPDYNVSPFNMHQNNVNQVQSTWSQPNNMYNFADMRSALDALSAVDEIFAGPTTAATTNNLVTTPHNAADLDGSDEQELEEEMQALEIRIGAVLKSAE
ncbi:PREDICTED: roquin-1 isoform X1 [Papilio xuthus]|uniref:RING-type E3 ubiquitin transferase n=2 Tax=Papilio xuthus TaxID=66420 RepID=A0AAJ6ZU04_PAPXU|nr:PREDICTED: roquin-1 isoform X1 [Papilio xuthus]